MHFLKLDLSSLLPSVLLGHFALDIVALPQFALAPLALANVHITYSNVYIYDISYYICVRIVHCHIYVRHED